MVVLRVVLFVLLLCTPVSAMEDGAKYMMRYFTVNGFTVSQSAGIVGNLMQESRLKPSAVGRNCYGLAQWQGYRFRQLKAYASKRGRPWTCRDTQLSFILHEFENGENRAGTQLKRTTTVHKATTVVGKLYLRPQRVEPSRYRYALVALEIGGLK